MKFKLRDHAVLVSRAGNMYRARFEGGTDSVFADDPSQAVQRLQKLPNMVSKPNLKPCDIAAERAEQREERAVQRALRKPHKDHL